MNTSLLSRLPDIVALARARARDLMDLPSKAPPTSGSAQPARSPDTDPTGARRVTLLCGQDLQVMLGLLSGHGPGGCMARGVPLIWLDPTEPTPATPEEGAPPELQRQTRKLLDFAVRLFVARELLARDGLLATPIPFDQERCAERLLTAVFGQVRWLVPPVRPLNCAPQGGVALAGRLLPSYLPPMGGRDLLFDLALHTTQRDDTVLMLPATPVCAGWVAALDRRWVLVQPDAIAFDLLKEQVIAREMRLSGAVAARESAREWASAL